MCFSATASFTAAATLAPIGLYAGYCCYRLNPRYMVFCLAPLVFAYMQFIEGILWIVSADAPSSLQLLLAKLYLFVPIFLIPCAIPLALYLVERRPYQLTALLLSLPVSVYAYLPLLVQPELLSVWPTEKHIEYRIEFIAPFKINSRIWFEFLHILYSVFYCGLLLTARHKQIKVIGGMLLLSVITTYIFWFQFKTSVWCFFAALISLYSIRLPFTGKRP